MTLKITQLPPNLAGRTFVCGDIHGSFSCVQRFLDEIRFDFDKDRLICAGDLVDRGPQNEECLELLWKPWFFITKGNHEQLMEEYFSNEYYGKFWGKNGGYWGQRYLTEQSDAADRIKSAIRLINDLSYLITTSTRDGKKFHVLHAELPVRKIPVTDTLLADPNAFTELATEQTHDGDIILWGRFIFASLCREELTEHAIKKFARRAELQKLGEIFNSELSHIYSGHTIVKRPVKFRGQTNLDTGAYGSYPVYNTMYQMKYDPPEWCGLTITEPETGKFWFSNDRVFKEVEPVIIE